MPYALLFNTDRHDSPSQPECRLIDAPDDDAAIEQGMRALLNRADAAVLSAPTRRIMGRYTERHKPPQVVKIHLISELSADTPGIEDIRKALVTETKEQVRINKAKQAREQEGWDRREYERLKAKFEPEG